MEVSYIVPSLEHFIYGVEYEVFETILTEEFKTDKGHFIIPGFTYMSDEYFKEIHSNNKYWKHRKWVTKIVDKKTLSELFTGYEIQKYTPLLIDNIYRLDINKFNNFIKETYGI